MLLPLLLRFDLSLSMLLILMRHIPRFLQAVPANLTPVLAAHTTLNLDQLGVLADELASMSLSSQTARNINRISNEQHRDRQRSPDRRRIRYRDASLERQNYHQDSRSRERAMGIRPYHENQKPKVCRFISTKDLKPEHVVCGVHGL